MMGTEKAATSGKALLHAGQSPLVAAARLGGDVVLSAWGSESAYAAGGTPW